MPINSKPRKKSITKSITKELTLQDIYDCMISNHEELSDSIHSLEKSLKSVNSKTVANTKAIEDVSTSLSKTDMIMESNEQNSRLNSLRIINGPKLPTDTECEKFLVDLLNKYLGSHLPQPIAFTDIDVAHRLGHEKNGRQDYIIKFVRRAQRNQVFYKKKFFAQSNGHIPNPDKTFVCEDLTFTRREIMKKLRSMQKDETISAFWSMHGELFVKKTEHSNRMKIKISSNIESVYKQIMGIEEKFSEKSSEEDENEL